MPVCAGGVRGLKPLDVLVLIHICIGQTVETTMSSMDRRVAEWCRSVVDPFPLTDSSSGDDSDSMVDSGSSSRTLESAHHYHASGVQRKLDQTSQELLTFQRMAYAEACKAKEAARGEEEARRENAQLREALRERPLRPTLVSVQL